MFLTFDQIQQIEDRQPVRVSVPEWGADAYVCVVPMSGADRDWYDQYQCRLRFPDDDQEPDWRGLRAGAIARCLCDEAGRVTRLSDLQIGELGNKNGAAIERIYQVVKRISGLGLDEEDEAKND